MSDDFYKELYASAQEALAIAKGEIEPSRVFTYERPNAKANSIYSQTQYPPKNLAKLAKSTKILYNETNLFLGECNGI